MSNTPKFQFVARFIQFQFYEFKGQKRIAKKKFGKLFSTDYISQSYTIAQAWATSNNFKFHTINITIWENLF